ncbi:MAG: FAD:protein FMN transferase [Bacteroidales bacterium]|nr:FAD:protein FMN transferase [Bacteroidales bacterium]
MRTQSSYSSSASLFQGSAAGIFGTDLKVQIAGLPEKKAYAVWSEITKLLSSLDKTFNRSNPESEVSLLNGSKVDIETSETMKEALVLCEQYLIKTKGLFDISKGEDKDIDFDGFVKGYALSKIAAVLKSGKVKDAFINFGGTAMLAIGKHPYGDCWTFTLENPETEDELKEFELRGECLSVSGNTPDLSGHIVNPLTHKVFEGSKLCCVRTKDPLDAEILSMALLLADEKQIREMSYNFKGIESEYFDL